MINYLVRRFLLVIPTFIGITLMMFAFTRFVPGGPIERMMAQMRFGGEGQVTAKAHSEQYGELTEEQLEELKKLYGFDKGIIEGYIDWLTKLVVFDFGQSTRYYEPVWGIIKERLPISTFYGIMTLVITYLVCIPLGVAKAIKHGSVLDTVSSIFVFIGYALPGFVVGMGLILLFAVKLKWFPIGGFTSDGFEDMTLMERIVDILYHAALPLTAYVLGSFAVMTLMVKNNLLENLSSEFMRTAMAKGLPFRKAVLRHALRNSLIPLATHFGNNISVVLTGSFLIEKVFNIDGFGLLGYESVVERDYPVVMGILVLSSLLLLLGNILSDICVALVDPRVKFS